MSHPSSPPPVVRAYTAPGRETASMICVYEDDRDNPQPLTPSPSSRETVYARRMFDVTYTPPPETSPLFLGEPCFSRSRWEPMNWEAELREFPESSFLIYTTRPRYPPPDIHPILAQMENIRCRYQDRFVDETRFLWDDWSRRVRVSLEYTRYERRTHRLRKCLIEWVDAQHSLEVGHIYGLVCINPQRCFEAQKAIEDRLACARARFIAALEWFMGDVFPEECKSLSSMVVRGRVAVNPPKDWEEEKDEPALRRPLVSRVSTKEGRGFDLKPGLFVHTLSSEWP